MRCAAAPPAAANTRAKRISPRPMIKDAYRFALPPLVAGALCFILGWKIFGAVLILLGLFIFYFFRDPQRVIPTTPGIILSPADGKIVEIIDEMLDSVMGHRVSI